jgi:peptidoglycan/LPS O-acetylase OafA/YrhL
MLANNNRFVELDGLRGVAAISVFFSHFIGLYQTTPKLIFVKGLWLGAFWNGDAAVNLFFVLSGFVLAISCMKARVNFLSFLIKRIFRIYPAYYFSIIIGLICIYFFRQNNMLDLSDWSQSFWKKTISAKLLLEHVLLVKNFDSRAINPVVWSLGIEVKMSLLIPGLVYFVSKKESYFRDIILLFFSYTLSSFFPLFFFLPQFALGVILAKRHTLLMAMLQNVSFITLVVLFLITISLYDNKFLFPNLVLNFPTFSTYLTGVGSFGLILLCSKIRILKNIFSSKFGVFLGKTSYSFYLIHLPILIVTCSLFFSIFHSILLCGLIALAVSLIFSYIIFVTIEKKAIGFGALISKKMLKIN